MYELIFWQYQDQIYLNHHLVYEQLDEQQIVQGLQELPIQVILNRINNVFCDWQKVDDNSYKNTKNSESFQILTTPQSIKIDCYGTHGETMDQLVEILDHYNCPLYDPQVPARYDEFQD